MSFVSDLANTGGLGGAGFLFRSQIKQVFDPKPLPGLEGPASLTENEGSGLNAQADIKGQKKALEEARKKRTGTTLTGPQGLLSTGLATQKTLLGA